jgi:hypothetical protein
MRLYIAITDRLKLMRRLLVVLLSLNSLVMVCFCARAESQTVWIQVSDVHDRPLPGAILSAKGNGSTSAPADKAGKTNVYIAPLQPGDELALILVAPKSPMRILSPWEGRGTVPKSSGFVEVVLGRAGDRAALNNQAVVWSMAAAVVETKEKSHAANPPTGEEALRQVAKEAELDPSAVDAAIRYQIRVVPYPTASPGIGLGTEYLRYIPKPIAQ